MADKKPRMIVFSTYITLRQIEAFDRLSAETKVPRSVLMREAFDDYLNFEAAKEANSDGGCKGV